MIGVAFLAFASLGPTSLQFEVGGVTRTALCFAPTLRTGAKAPLVIAFHGYTGTAEYASKQFEVQKYWPQAFVLYPQGLRTKLFPSQREEHPGWQLLPNQSGNRDVDFVKAMLNWAEKKSTIDLSRIYFEGHSNGSGFSWVVLKELGNRFTAFAALCGGTLLPLDGAAKKPAILFTSAGDKLVPAQSVRNFAERLAKHNGCSAPFLRGNIKTYPGPAPVIIVEYDGGHIPPNSAFEQAVNFFKNGKP